MEEQLRALLAEDETLLWSGRPEAFETMDKTNKKSITTWLIIKVAVTVALLIMYINAALNGVGIKVGVIIFILAIAAFAIASPFLIARRLQMKTYYGLTEKRVLRAGANTESVPYERMKSVVLRTDEDGHTTLLCGPNTQNLKPHQWRGEADAAFINGPDDPEAVRVILYNLPMNDELEALLRKHLPIK